jgi:hypothetical protein
MQWQHFPVVGTVAGQRDLYRRLASMTDVELLAALAADNLELILEDSRFPPGTNGPGPTPHKTLDTGQGSKGERREIARTLEQRPPPQRSSTSQQGQPHTARQLQLETADQTPATSKHASSAAANGPVRNFDQWEEGMENQEESNQLLLAKSIPPGE